MKYFSLLVIFLLGLSFCNEETQTRFKICNESGKDLSSVVSFYLDTQGFTTNVEHGSLSFNECSMWSETDLSNLSIFASYEMGVETCVYITERELLSNQDNLFIIHTKSVFTCY